MAYLRRNVMLRGLTYRHLYDALDKSDDEFTKYLQELGLLHSKRTCRICGMFCETVNTRGNVQFRCSVRKCRKTISMRAATMFDGSKLSMKQIFELSYYWCRNNVNYEEVSFQTRKWNDAVLAKDTWVDWKQFFRDVCAEFFIENPIQIGGPDVYVEIDETFLARRKYQRGRIRKNHGQWIFGGVVMLQNAFQHLTINHSVNFVDPDNSNIHTQSVENCWSRFKREHRQRHGCPKHMLVEYISEFLWRQKNKGPDVFFHFWDMVARIYPVEAYTPPESEDEEIDEENVENQVENTRISFDRVYLEEW